MERGWMYSSKAPDPKFVHGVDSFVKTARAYCINRLQDDDHVYCPCVDCRNQKQFRNIEQIRCHLLVRGFMANYKIWNKHGEDGENLQHDTSRHDTVQELCMRISLKESMKELRKPSMKSAMIRWLMMK